MGKFVAQLLLESNQTLASELQLKKIFVRDLQRKWEAPDHLLTTEVTDIIENPQIDLVAELIGGIDPAKSLIQTAINNGKHVVTANRPLISLYGKELLDLANQKSVYLTFEGSVGCGIPILTSLQGLGCNKINRIIGILNGTCNFILTKMYTSGCSFSEALDHAISLGLTEPNVKDDLEGLDAAQKLSILSLVGFQTQVDFHQIKTQGIAGITKSDISYMKSLEFTPKQLAIISVDENNILSFEVGPYLIHRTSPLFAIDGIVNTIFLEADPVGPLMFYGKGVSPSATASAVIADIIAITRGSERWRNIQINTVHTVNYTPQNQKKRFYIRLRANKNDYPLNLIMEKFGLRDLLFFRREGPEILLITEPLAEISLNKSMNCFHDNTFIEEMIRMPILDH